MILQRLYCAVLNPIGRQTQKLSEGARDAVVFVAFFLLMAFNVIYASFEQIWWGGVLWGLYYDPVKTMIIGSVLILVAAVFSIRGELKPLKLNWIFVVIFCVAFALIFAAGSLHYVGGGYRIFPLITVFIFPALFLVIGNSDDAHRIYRLLAWAVCVAGLVVFVLSILTAPNQSADRYQGMTGNPNALGFNTVAYFAGAFYLLLTERGWRIVFPAVCAAGNFGMLFLSGSRASLLCACGVFICAMAMLIKGGWQKEGGGVRTARAVVSIAIIVLAIPFTQFALSNPNPVDMNANSPFQWHRDNQPTPYPPVAGETKKPAKPPSTGQTGASGSVSKPGEAAAQTPGLWKSLNKISSGRLDGWKVFLSKVTLKGTDPSAEKIWVNGVLFPGAHNAAIDIAYRCGAFAGIFYFLLLASTFFFVLRRTFSRKRFSPYTLFPCIGIASYLGVSMLDLPIMPFDATSALLFFLSLSPMVFLRKKLPTI